MSDRPRLIDGEWRSEIKHRKTRRLRDWDYCQRAIYEITVVLADRSRSWLGELKRLPENGQPQNRLENAQPQDLKGNAQPQGRLETELPQNRLGAKLAWNRLGANSGRGENYGWGVEPTADGLALVEALMEMPRHYPQVSIIEWQLMPEHFHFIVFVRESLPKPLGALVRGFKAGAAKRWKELRENAQPRDQRENGQQGEQPENGLPQNLNENGLPQDRGENGRPQDRGGGDAVARFRATCPEWAKGFNDTILFREGQLEQMITYLRKNPLRLATKRAKPALFRVLREIEVSLGAAGAGHFAALGNHFLLDRPLAQVQVSRRFFGYKRVAKPGGGLKIAKDAKGEPLVEFSTPEFEERRDELIEAAKHGAVLLSPCVSDGERQIAREALAAGLPLVTMANKGFSKLQKPSGRYFDACAEGKLLMLAPAAWPYVPGEKPMTRFDATAMNRLCQWIAGEGAAEINYHGMKPANIDDLARQAAMC